MTMRAALVYSNDDGFALGAQILRAVVEQRVPESEVSHTLWFQEPVGTLTDDYLGHYNRFLAQLYARRPDVLAFSAFVWNHDEFVRMGQLTRRHLPECRIVWGGGQTDSRRMAQRLLETYPWLDLVMRGEGEDSYPLLLQALANGTELAAVPGLSWRRDGELVHNPDSPEVDLREVPRVFTPKRPDFGPIFRRYPRAVLSYETGRGCRQKCGFCLYSSSKLRVFDMDRVAAELAILLDAGIPNLRICDAHLGISRPRAMEIFEIVAEHNRGTVVDVYPDTKHVDLDYVRAMNRAGCRVISLGLQSSDRGTLLVATRRFDEERFAQTAQLIRRHHNHRLAADIIIGMPGDDYEKVRESVRFAYRSGIEKAHFAPLMAFPGTEFYENSEAYGLDYFDFSPPLVWRARGFSTHDYGLAMVMAQRVEMLQDEAPTVLRCLIALDDADPVAFAESLDRDPADGDLLDSPELLAALAAVTPEPAQRLLRDALAWDLAARDQVRGEPVELPELTDELLVRDVRSDRVTWLDYPMHRLVGDFALRFDGLSPDRYGYLRPDGGTAVYLLAGPLQVAAQTVRPGISIGEWRAALLGAGVPSAVAAEAMRLLLRCGLAVLGRPPATVPVPRRPTRRPVRRRHSRVS